MGAALTLALANKVSRSDNAAAEALHDEHIILDLGSGEYFGTGSVGGFIWERLDGERELGNIATEIAASFDVGLEQAEADLLEFVNVLIERGLAQSR